MSVEGRTERNSPPIWSEEFQQRYIVPAVAALSNMTGKRLQMEDCKVTIFAYGPGQPMNYHVSI